MGINACTTKEGDTLSEDTHALGIDRIAGVSLKQLLEQYRYYLFDNTSIFIIYACPNGGELGSLRDCCKCKNY